MNKWTDYRFAVVPQKVDAERLVICRRIGKYWALRRASLEQIQSIVVRVGKDPAAFVNRSRKDKKTDHPTSAYFAQWME